MAIHKVSLVGYRGFGNEQSLSLAQPDSTPGSGLTVLVGPNNSGKSALIEALQFLQESGTAPELHEAHRNALTGGDLRIAYSLDDLELSLTSEAGGMARWSPNIGSLRPGSVLTLSPRRAFNSRFNRSPTDRATYARSIQLAANRGIDPAQFAGRLSATADRSQFNAILSRVLGEAPAWYVEQQQGGGSYVKVTSAASPHSSDGLGSGVTSLFMIVDAIHDARPDDMVVIDEPELSLHPSVQRRLLREILRFSATHQVVLATHSPNFVDMGALARGGRLARVGLVGKQSKIWPLSQATASQLAALQGDLNNPHTVGDRAKEALFLSEGVILVEGQDDVIGYTRLFENYSELPNAEFFGWGAGGAGKMEILAKLLSELGFARVMGILDAGQDAVADALGKQFPAYLFRVISAEDIRDKPPTARRQGRSGLLTSRMELKSEHRQEAMTLHRSVLDYFGSRS